jgi:hypothetical protein
MFYTEGYQESRIREKSKNNCLKECTLVGPEWFSRFRGAANS